MALNTKLEDLKLFGRWVVEKLQVSHTERREKAIEEKKTYGIICAMNEEVRPITEQMTGKKLFRIGGMIFYVGDLNGKKAVVVKCGIGKVNAAVCTTILCQKFKVDAVINVGVAGTPHPEIQQKDIVISTQTVQHDMDVTALGYAPGEHADFKMVYFPASQELVRLAHQAAEIVVPEEVHIFEGTIASGDQFVAEPEKSNRILQLFSAMAVEMEGAAVGQAAMIHEVPYVVIRGISDNADHSAELSYNEYVKKAAVISADVVCKMMEMV